MTSNTERSAMTDLTESEVRAQVAQEIRDYWDKYGEFIYTNHGARLAFDAIAAAVEQASPYEQRLDGGLTNDQ